MLGFKHVSLVTTLAFVVATPVAAQSIHGLVLNDSTSEPVPLAEVTLVDSLGHSVTHTVSDSDGRFRLQIGHGSYAFRVIKIGYAPTVTTAFEVGEAERELNVVVRVPVASALNSNDPYALTPVVVEGARTPRHLAPFYRSRVAGEGDYVLRDEFEQWKPQKVTDVIRRMRGFSIVSNSAYMTQLPDGSTDTRQYVISNSRRSGRCPPAVYLDGVRFGNPAMLDVDDLPVQALEAVETHPLAAGGCGSLRLWSRQPDPAEKSPFELGARYGGVLTGDGDVGSRLGLHLVTPFVGPTEFYSAFHFLLTGPHTELGPGNSSWQAHLALRLRPHSAFRPVYLGTGIFLFRPAPALRAPWSEEDGSLDIAHTLFTGLAVDVGPMRPFAEVHALNVFKFAERELRMFVGLGIEF